MGLSQDVFNWAGADGKAMDAVKCEGYKKGNKIVHAQDNQQQGKRWQMRISDVKLAVFTQFLGEKNGVSARSYEFTIAKLKSKKGSYSAGMRDACKQAGIGMKPVCDHPSYCRNDQNALYLGQNNHIAYRPYRYNANYIQNWFPAGFMTIR